MAASDAASPPNTDMIKTAKRWRSSDSARIWSMLSEVTGRSGSSAAISWRIAPASASGSRCGFINSASGGDGGPGPREKKSRPGGAGGGQRISLRLHQQRERRERRLWPEIIDTRTGCRGEAAGFRCTDDTDNRECSADKRKHHAPADRVHVGEEQACDILVHDGGSGRPLFVRRRKVATAQQRNAECAEKVWRSPG